VLLADYDPGLRYLSVSALDCTSVRAPVAARPKQHLP
jgi:hypothetical protein